MWKAEKTTPERTFFVKGDLVAEVLTPAQGPAVIKQVKSFKGVVGEADEELTKLVEKLNTGKSASTRKLEKDAALLTDASPVERGSRLGKAHDPTKKVARLAKTIGSMRYI